VFPAGLTAYPTKVDMAHVRSGSMEHKAMRKKFVWQSAEDDQLFRTTNYLTHRKEYDEYARRHY
jgi:hypothetical protein